MHIRRPELAPGVMLSHRKRLQSNRRAGSPPPGYLVSEAGYKRLGHSRFVCGKYFTYSLPIP